MLSEGRFWEGEEGGEEEGRGEVPEEVLKETRLWERTLREEARREE